MPRRFANSNGRARVSKDEHGPGMALMLRDASQRASAVEASALASCCDAPQHEGEGRRVVPAKGTPRQQKRVYARLRRAMRRGDPVAGTHNHRRWLWVPALPSLSRGSAGTTIAWSAQSTNLRVCETGAGAISLLWGCSFTMTFATPTCRPRRDRNVSPQM
jgi:hypothetical protein